MRLRHRRCRLDASPEQHAICNDTAVPTLGRDAESGFGPYRCEGCHSHLVGNEPCQLSAPLCYSLKSPHKGNPAPYFSTRWVFKVAYRKGSLAPAPIKPAKTTIRTSPTTTPSSKPVMTHTHSRDETLMCVKKQQSMLLEQRTAIAPVNNFNDKSGSSSLTIVVYATTMEMALPICVPT
jgi:hypothetical protein